MLREFFPQFYIHHNFFGRFQHGIRLKPPFFMPFTQMDRQKTFPEAAMENVGNFVHFFLEDSYKTMGVFLFIFMRFLPLPTQKSAFHSVYFEFTTTSFSPFVLAYATESEPSPSTEPKPTPTTEPTPVPSTEPSPAPTAEPTAAVTPTPALESSAPQTGDTTNLVMWVVILCIGAACLTITLVYFRMQKKAGHRR